MSDEIDVTRAEHEALLKAVASNTAVVTEVRDILSTLTALNKAAKYAGHVVKWCAVLIAALVAIKTGWHSLFGTL